MRRTFHILLFLGLVGAVFLPGHPAVNVRVLGNLKGSDCLFDGTADRKAFVELDLKTPATSGITFLLEKPASLKSVTLVCVEPVPPVSLTVEISGDLFNWQTVKTVKLKSRSKKGVQRVDVPADSRTALFVRATFAAAAAKTLRICEAVLDTDLASSVKSVRVERLTASEDSLTVRLVSDADVIGSVRYGEELSRLADGPIIANYSRAHTLVIPGLLKGTEYYVVGIGQDSNGNMKYSEPVKLRTAGIPLPRFRRIDVGPVSADSFRCRISANVEAKCTVSAGYPASVLRETVSAGYALQHNLLFTNLGQERDFNFRVLLEDRPGNRILSEMNAVRTRPANVLQNAIVTGDFDMAGESIAPAAAENLSVRLSDGDFSYLGGSVMSGDIYGSDQILVFDLGSARLLERLDLVWWGLAYSTRCRVLTGPDGVSWQPAGTGTEPDARIRLGFISNIPYMITRVSLARDARFVKVICDKGQFKSRFPEYRNLRLLEAFLVPQMPENNGFKAVFE